MVTASQALQGCLQAVRVCVLKCPMDLGLALASAWGPLAFFVALLQAFLALETPTFVLTLGLEQPDEARLLPHKHTRIYM